MFYSALLNPFDRFVAFNNKTDCIETPFSENFTLSKANIYKALAFLQANNVVIQDFFTIIWRWYFK